MGPHQRSAAYLKTVEGLIGPSFTKFKRILKAFKSAHSTSADVPERSLRVLVSEIGELFGPELDDHRVSVFSDFAEFLPSR
jgi:hypothetical protein